MNNFSTMNIGFVLSDGHRSADIIELHPIFTLHPANRIHHIASGYEAVYGRESLPMMPTKTFDDCPLLDVLIIGEMPESSVDDERLKCFILKQAMHAQYVIAISNGVFLLAKQGLLAGRQVTADQNTLKKLSDYGAIPIDKRESAVDGKFYTSGPSTGAMESAFNVMQHLRGRTITRFLELNLEYDPQAQYAQLEMKEPPASFFEASPPLKVAVLIPPHVFTPDVVGAVDVLNALPDTEFYYVWKTPGESKGILSPNTAATCSFEACPEVDILIVGALLPQVSCDPDVQAFVRHQSKHAKAIISVCAGTFVIGGAGLLKGRNAASNFHMTPILPCVGAIPSHRPVEFDDKYFSAGPAVGSYEVALKAVDTIYGADVAGWIEQQVLEYSPHPLYGVGSPEKATPWLRRISMALIGGPLNPIYRYFARKGYRRIQAEETGEGTAQPIE